MVFFKSLLCDKQKRVIVFISGDFFEMGADAEIGEFGLGYGQKI